MRHHLRLAPLLLLLAAALAVGCGSDDSDGTGTTVTTEAPAADEGEGAPLGVRAESCPIDDMEIELRVTGVDCDSGSEVYSEWNEDPGCAPSEGESRSACSVGEFRCLAVAVGPGTAVSCAAPERSIAFIVRR
jgi:hypothetical protein